ncbi:MAG TPA: LPS assembly lipoprotein LptE [Lacunisphaera sp.]|nr:LPS assembly lipoprotein LptE [Lacunisphaera sp.]
MISPTQRRQGSTARVCSATRCARPVPARLLRPGILRHEFLGTILVLFTILGFSGCTGYRLGTGAEPKFATLYIAPVKSEALVPQARTLVTTAVREAFIRDGRVALVNTPGEAEAVLEITLSGYGRTETVARSDDTGLGRRFDVSLTAFATLTDNRAKQPYFSRRTLDAKRGAFTDSGLVPSEYQALPLLAELLATEAVHAALDTW